MIVNLSSIQKPQPKPITKGKLDVQELMLQWNLRYPFDRWWRNKHEIPFGSITHRETTLLQMVFELREDMYFRRLAKEAVEEPDDELASEMLPDGREMVKMTAKEVDEEYDNLNLQDFNNG